MGHDDLKTAASEMAGIMGPAAYGDGSSIVPKKKPTKKPRKPKKPKPRPKPKPKPKKPSRATGGMSQLGKNEISQLEAIGYIDKPK